MQLSDKQIASFFSKVEKTEHCWRWKASTKNGYGQFSVNSHPIKAHRASYMIHFGDVPTGQGVLHWCDNKECSNPDHLYAGTQKRNVEDMISRKRHWQQQKDHCVAGHPLSGGNLYIYGGRRKCRACHSRRNSEYKSANLG